MLRLSTVVLATVAFAIAVAGRRAPSDPRRAPTPKRDSVSVWVTLPEYRLELRSANGIERSYRIAIGLPEYPTPTGRFTVRKIVWNPAWRPHKADPWATAKKPQPPGARDNPMKVVKIFFVEPAYYIHGTSELHTLGTAASHGCIRMHPDDAAELATRLMEETGAQDREWVAAVRRRRTVERVVILPRPVSLTITR